MPEYFGFEVSLFQKPMVPGTQGTWKKLFVETCGWTP